LGPKIFKLNKSKLYLFCDYAPECKEKFSFSAARTGHFIFVYLPPIFDTISSS